MTGQVDIERLLDGWLAGGPAVMPDGFLASVAEGIARRPQRVTWRLRGAAIPARSVAAFASGAVAIALVAVLGFNLATPPPAASPTPTGPGPTPSTQATTSSSPSPSPSPSSRPPSPSPSSEPTDEPGPTPSPVAAGTYAMPVGPLFLTFTVPDGWAFDNRGGSETGISSASDPWQKYIDFMYDIYPLRGTWPACGAQTDWESPHTARDFVDYLEARPDWSGTATRTRIGGLTGWRLDGEFQASPCTIDYTVRWSDNIPTSVGVGPGPWDVYVLDDGSGSTLLLEVKGDTEFIDSAQSVIDTFEFSNQPPPSATSTPFAAGPYTTLAWQPQLTLTVPEGWVVTRDESNALALASTSDARHKVEVLRNAYQPNPSCGFADDWFSPHTALGFIHKLQSRPNWYGTITPAFVGGLEGWQVDGVLDFEGCETRYTVPSSVGAPTRQNQLGHWTFYVLDESGSTILLSADDGDSPDAAAQSVFDSFHFADAPPARCDELSPVPSAPTSTPGNDRLDLESAFWLDPTDGYRYVVVGTGRDHSVAADVEVTLTNACGATEQDIVNLGTLKPGETHAALASVNPGFVPVRIDVHQSLTYQLKTLPAADCNRRPDGQDRDGQVTVRGVISTTPYLVDLYFDAVAIYRNRTGAVVGADKVSLLHPGTGTQATEFEIPPSTVWPDAVSTDFVCYPTAFEW